MSDSAHFFRPGGTMDPSAPCYIERQADAEMLRALLAREYVFLLDSRQKGKSSMVARTIIKLKDAGVTAIKLDLQRIGANVTPEQWYAGLIAAVAGDLGLAEAAFKYWGQNQQVGPLARWIGALTEVVLPKTSSPIVIFVDEVDFVRALPFPTDEFFAGIRDCYNRRSEGKGFDRLTFCFVGVATPGQLIRNPEITPFNIGRRIDLSDFTSKETQVFADVLKSGGKDGQRLMARVHYWLNGHPYLTQLLCSQIVGDPSTRTARDVDDLVRRLFLTPEARQREPNLTDVERRMLDPDVPGLSGEERRTQVLELYGRVLKGKRVDVAEENPVVATLRLSGVGLEDRRALRVRNRLYRLIFDEKWRRNSLPDAEVRRQRGAARVALLRTATVAGVVVLAVSTGAIGVWKLSGERQTALTALEKRTLDLSITSNERQRALTNLESRSQELAKVSAERQRAFSDLKERSRQISDLSNERQTALQNLMARTEDLKRISGDRQKSIELLQAKTEELEQTTYDAIMGNINSGLMAESAKQVITPASRIRESKYRGWEYGHLSLLLDKPDYEVKLPNYTTFEENPDGWLIAANEHELVEVGARGTGRLTPIHIPFTETERRDIYGRGQAYPYWPTGRRGTIRLWHYTNLNADAIHDAASHRLLVPAKPNAWIFDVHPGGSHYLTSKLKTNLLELRTIQDDQLVTSMNGLGEISTAHFVPDGSILVSVAPTPNKWEFRLLDRSGRTLKRSSELPFRPTYTMTNHAGTQFATWGENKLQIRNLADLSVKTQLSDHGLDPSVIPVTFSKNDSLLATGCVNGTLRVFDVVTGELRRKIFAHTRSIRSVAFVPGEKQVASLDNDGKLSIWPLKKHEALRELKDIPARVAHFGPDNSQLISYTNSGTLVSRNLETGQVVRRELGECSIRVGGPEPFVYVLRPGGTVHSLDPFTLQDVRSSRPFIEEGTAFPINTLPRRRGLIVFHRSTAQLNANRKVDPVTLFAILDPRTLKVRARFSGPNTGWLWSVTWDRLGRRIAVTAENETEITLYNSENGAVLKRIRLDEEIQRAALSPDGNTIAVVLAKEFKSEDAKIVLLDTSTGKKVGQFEYQGLLPTVIRFSRDGQILGGATRSSVGYLWNVKTRKLIATLSESVNVRDLWFSNDSQRVVTKGIHPTFTVWNARTGAELMTLPLNEGPALPGLDTFPSFSRDGRYITSTCRDGVTRIWDSLPPKGQASVVRK